MSRMVDHISVTDMLTFEYNDVVRCGIVDKKFSTGSVLLIMLRDGEELYTEDESVFKSFNVGLMDGLIVKPLESTYHRPNLTFKIR